MPRGEDSPPEQERGDHEAKMLEGMHRVAVEGRLVGTRQVPHPQGNGVESERSGRSRQNPPAGADGNVLRCRSRLDAPRRWDSPERWNKRATQYQQRRTDGDE